MFQSSIFPDVFAVKFRGDVAVQPNAPPVPDACVAWDYVFFLWHSPAGPTMRVELK